MSFQSNSIYLSTQEEEDLFAYYLKHCSLVAQFYEGIKLGEATANEIIREHPNHKHTYHNIKRLGNKCGSMTGFNMA